MFLMWTQTVSLDTKQDLLIKPIKIQVSKMKAYFPPKDDPYPELIHLINIAKYSIYVQAYQLAHQPVAEALLNAHKRGVKVLVVVDKSQNSRYEAPRLDNEGMAVFVDYEPRIAHNKVMIIDSKTVIAGSFNYSNNALKNAENLIIFSDEVELAKAYIKNFGRRFGKSVALKQYINEIKGKSCRKTS